MLSSAKKDVRLQLFVVYQLSVGRREGAAVRGDSLVLTRLCSKQVNNITQRAGDVTFYSRCHDKACSVCSKICFSSSLTSQKAHRAPLIQKENQDITGSRNSTRLLSWVMYDFFSFCSCKLIQLVQVRAHPALVIFVSFFCAMS